MIEFRRVVKAFNDQVVLDGVSFQIARGETKLIMGASGSGKSTILKLILGLIHPDAGEILIEDRDISALDEKELGAVRQRMGMVFQEGALFDSLTVRENVGYRLYEAGEMSEQEIEQVVLRILGFVGLEDAIDKMPGELSGGMKRRVGIARAMVGEPPIILYDEPTAGLDPITKRTILEQVIKLRDLQGVTSVFVTHDLHAAEILATEWVERDGGGRVLWRRGQGSAAPLNNNFVMLRDGAILFEGSMDDLRASEDPYIREFIA
jgi:phospholipid/cholesterol/gamma-HCH transport system ATP-binding protein